MSGPRNLVVISTTILYAILLINIIYRLVDLFSKRYGKKYRKVLQSEQAFLTLDKDTLKIDCDTTIRNSCANNADADACKKALNFLDGICANGITADSYQYYYESEGKLVVSTHAGTEKMILTGRGKSTKIYRPNPIDHTRETKGVMYMQTVEDENIFLYYTNQFCNLFTKPIEIVGQNLIFLSVAIVMVGCAYRDPKSISPM